MYAIIEESGSQRKVTQGETILIDLLDEGNIEAGKAVTFDKVLVVGEVGGSAKLGQPYVAGATVARSPASERLRSRQSSYRGPRRPRLSSS